MSRLHSSSLPLFVEVHEEIDAPAPVPLLRVHREVGVHVEEAAPRRLMQPTTFERLVDEEVVNAGELAEEVNESGRLQVVEHVLQDGSPCLGVNVGVLAFVHVDVAHPLVGRQRRERGHGGACDRGLEQILEHDVRERVRRPVGLGQLRQPGLEGVEVERGHAALCALCCVVGEHGPPSATQKLASCGSGA
jgi:hypothetical protein